MGVIKEGMEAWRLAWCTYDPGEILEFMEEKIRVWQESNTIIEFNNSYEIKVACILLIDGVLPIAAQRALAVQVTSAVEECYEKRLKVDSLKIVLGKAGRKEESRTKGYMILKTLKLIREGMPKQQAYELVAEEIHKSPDTIRRACERALKRRKESKGGN